MHPLEAARRLRVCPVLVWKLARQGALRRVYLSPRQARVYREDVEALLHPEWGWGPKRK